ncbi:GNAT family N-acetyltransferase [Gephyromycinifex aptenodytis]|uniref:GNAT family N-acetyltransferase n=1 Tax=Gephyromycinifex aptenodytis TaxID=2716227 RepID=UPI00144575D6|nr:GNAT family N-acetyltransferase [Gephyromycinifex aptenodytis]
MSGNRPWPCVVETERLRLRPPQMQDAAFHHAVHSDARLFSVPGARRSTGAESLAEFTGWLRSWERDGICYWLVEDRHTGAQLGFAGVRRESTGLNLYYRLSYGAHGYGFGAEAAKATLAWACEWLPEPAVHGVIRFDNTASIRSAEAAGLVCTEPRDALDPDGSAASGSRYGRWVSPTLVPISPEQAGEPGLAEEIVSLLRDHPAASSPGGTSPAVRRMLLALAREESVLLTLRAHDGQLIGCGWAVVGIGTHAHTATVSHLCVRTPGRGHGRMLLAGLHGLLRREHPQVELVAAETQGDPRAEGLLSALGYREVGRLPGFVKVPTKEPADQVIFLRALTPSAFTGSG